MGDRIELNLHVDSEMIPNPEIGIILDANQTVTLVRHPNIAIHYKGTYNDEKRDIFAWFCFG